MGLEYKIRDRIPNDLRTNKKFTFKFDHLAIKQFGEITMVWQTLGDRIKLKDVFGAVR